MSVKVLALGNILMKDDGVGIEVAKELEGRLNSCGIEVIYGETNIGYCISKVRDEDTLFILDASYFDITPGEVTVLPLEAHTGIKKEITQHSLSFLSLHKHYFKHLKGLIFAIEAQEITFETGLSTELKSILNDIAQNIYDMILEYQHKN